MEKNKHQQTITISNGTIKRAIEKFRKPVTHLSPGDIRERAEYINNLGPEYGLDAFISESIYDWSDKETRDVEAWMIWDTIHNDAEYKEWMEMQ